jgi:SET domain-containing protein
MQATRDRSASRARSSHSPQGAARKPRKAKAAQPPVIVRRSAIQGQGVFATRDIAKGKRIIEYTGERISHEEAGSRYDDEAVERHHTFLFAVDDDLCIDGSHEGNEARFINHSCAPNAYALIDRRRVFIVAKKNIKDGDEILYDYWYTTDETYTLDDLKRLYPCRCGSPKCRGTLAAVKKPRVKKNKDGKDAKASADASTAKADAHDAHAAQ